MTATLDSNTVLQHLRLSDGEDTNNLDLYTNAAILATQQYLNRPLYNDQASIDADIASGAITTDDNPCIVDELVEGAILLLIGSMYLRREADAAAALSRIPYGFEWLLSTYRFGQGI